MIFKVVKRKKRPFLIMDKEALLDPRLSFKSKGVLAYLLSYTTNWEVRVADLMNHSNDGKKAIRRALLELREAGYATLIKPHSESGDFAGSYWAVYETPELNANNSRTSPKGDCPQRGGIRNNNEEERKKKAASAATRSPSFGVNAQSSVETLCKEFANFTASKGLHIGNTGATKTGWEQRTIRRWGRTLEDLIEQVGNAKEIERTMHWYFAHYGEEYVPTAETMNAFCRKYLKFRRAIERSENGHRKKQEADDGDDEQGYYRINATITRK